MNATLIGYALLHRRPGPYRAARQLRELGVAEERIYLDHGLTGANPKRPGLDQALAAVRAGDTLAQTRPARPVGARRPRHRRRPSGPRHQAVARRAGLRPGRPDGQDVLQYPGHLRRVRGRPAADAHPRSMAVARAKGKLRGKQPKLSARQRRELARMAATGEYTITDLAEVFTISRATVYRTLQRARAADETR